MAAPLLPTPTAVVLRSEAKHVSECTTPPCGLACEARVCCACLMIAARGE